MVQNKYKLQRTRGFVGAAATCTLYTEYSLYPGQTWHALVSRSPTPFNWPPIMRYPPPGSSIIQRSGLSIIELLHAVEKRGIERLVTATVPVRSNQTPGPACQGAGAGQDDGTIRTSSIAVIA